MGRTHEVDGPDSIVPSFSLWSITIWVRILWGLFANLCCRGLELCELGATWVAYFTSCRMYYIIIRKYMNIWWKYDLQGESFCFLSEPQLIRLFQALIDKWSPHTVFRGQVVSKSHPELFRSGSSDRRPKFPKEYGRIMKDLSNFQGVRSPSKVLPDKCLLPLFLIRNDPNHVAWQILTTSLNLWGLAW